MSDVMLLGVLRMPPTMWNDGAIDVAQRYSRYLEAADRIESDEAKIAEMQKQITLQMELIDKYNSKVDFPDRVANVVATTILGIFVIYLITMFF